MRLNEDRLFKHVPQPAPIEVDDIETEAIEPDAIEPDALEPDAIEPNAIEPNAIESDAIEQPATDPTYGSIASRLGRLDRRLKIKEEADDSQPVESCAELEHGEINDIVSRKRPCVGFYAV
eukprot:jgi/Ulvmu1/4225/UM019_0204.1